MLDVCTSAEDLRRNRSLSTYETIAISPILLQGYHLLKYKAERHLFAPLLVTACLEDRVLASKYLEKDAFDLIVKPIVPQETAQTVKLAPWQSSLLRLLASRERATERFRQRMEAFPMPARWKRNLRLKWPRMNELSTPTRPACDTF